MPAAAVPARSVRPLFVLTILLSSFLLFLVQPMVARMALPRLGGAPAVWNSAMLVYQALLLAGYAYAHRLSRLAPRRQALLHLVVLLVAALWLPIGLLRSELPPGASPALWVPWLLGVSIGPLFFAISAQAPLLQRWFSLSFADHNPYALYAASNFGSFAGLIAYPLLVEPQMALISQRWLWTGGYILVGLLVAACAVRLTGRTVAATVPTPSSAPPTRRMWLYWIALALVPSGLMLATSTYITTDIVAMPLLWVLPLGLYLLSFTVAFAGNRFLADTLTTIAPIVVLLAGTVLISGSGGQEFLNAGLALLLLFVVSVALHGEMYRQRPPADQLTGFYLAMSVGGALGGVFSGLIAPLLFDWTYEFPILILAAGALVPQIPLVPGFDRLWHGRPQRQRTAALGVAVVMALLILYVLNAPGLFDGDGTVLRALVFVVIVFVGLVVIGARAAYIVALAGALIAFGGYRSLLLSLEPNARTRSYFGVYTVRETPKLRQLAHGTTVHGTQLIGSPALERTPTAYYVPGSGVGQAMLAAPSLYGPHARIGVVGLGSGTLACYARAGEDWRFYEIDPAIVRIARDTGQFTFLRDCLPNARIEIGDARLSLAADRTARLDLLALDAFSSDAVPMHLMTREAFASYARILSPSGVLLVHISNRFLDLQPVVSAAAIAGGWQAAELTYRPPGGTSDRETVSMWIALSRDRRTIAALRARDADWQGLARYPRFTPWSDDYSTILPLVRALH